MFKTFEIKNYKRVEESKIQPIKGDKLVTFQPDERTLPYFEVVPEQFLADMRYNKLSRQDQGDFLRFALLLWTERCRHIRHAGVIAQNLGMEAEEWTGLENRLHNAGLIIITKDNNYIIQPELREQYLQTLKSNNNMRRCKK